MAKTKFPSWHELAPHRFIALGLEYYVAGRFAFHSRCVYISATLYHHAVEMFLKAQLSKRLPEAALRDKKQFGHGLTDLWKAFKSDFNDKALDSLDRTIRELNDHEEIRYPTTDKPSGATITVSGGEEIGVITGLSAKYYKLPLGGCDRLIQTIFRKMGANAEAYCKRFGSEAIEMLLKNNSYPPDHLHLP